MNFSELSTSVNLGVSRKTFWGRTVWLSPKDFQGRQQMEDWLDWGVVEGRSQVSFWERFLEYKAFLIQAAVLRFLRVNKTLLRPSGHNIFSMFGKSLTFFLLKGVPELLYKLKTRGSSSMKHLAQAPVRRALRLGRHSAEDSSSHEKPETFDIQRYKLQAESRCTAPLVVPVAPVSGA